MLHLMSSLCYFNLACSGEGSAAEHTHKQDIIHANCRSRCDDDVDDGGDLSSTVRIYGLCSTGLFVYLIE